jgi:L-alanine-DL-glutamate epimerase-like enolase superfamily enzyme
MLSELHAWRLALPLTTPYHLSFGDLHAYDTVLVRVSDAQGREGWGEATVLTGYTDETIEGTWAGARELVQALAGRSEAQALAQLAERGREAPFLATAFASAVEMLQGSPWLAGGAPLAVPVLGTVNATEPQAMRAQIDALCAAGHRSLKIKVGTDAEADAARVRAAQAHVAGRALLRVDANQGFSPADARRFAQAVPPQGIELFEQPCAAGDWAAHAEVAAGCPLPLMLDESIYDEADIERAARDGGTRFVKLKLMKFVTLQRLAHALGRIRALGMVPVLGNGVATEIGCWMEACVAPATVDNAGEMNGWTKMARPLLRNPPRLEGGALHVPAQWRPQVDPDALAAATVEVAQAAVNAARNTA